MTLKSIIYENGKLLVLNQLLLPHETVYDNVTGTRDAYLVIQEMRTRGAPAIAMVGMLAVALDIQHPDLVERVKTKEDLLMALRASSTYICNARPTAVNIAEASQRVDRLADDLSIDDNVSLDQMRNSIIETIEDMLEDDVATNESIGDHGAVHILQHPNTGGDKKVNILTHCNTGSLATAGYGTALGVIRSLKSSDAIERVYCTETRPYMQGSRLTTYELIHEQIPSSLICDSAAAALMKCRRIHAVVVGADRVTANGDTANKIGTYMLAVVAKHHNVPFYVAAPRTSIDLTLATGEEIPIEQRSESEMKSIKGIPITPPETVVWNPAFDVTPADLITGGIITEIGVFSPKELRSKLESAKDLKL